MKEEKLIYLTLQGGWSNNSHELAGYDAKPWTSLSSHGEEVVRMTLSMALSYDDDGKAASSPDTGFGDIMSVLAGDHGLSVPFTPNMKVKNQQA